MGRKQILFILLALIAPIGAMSQLRPLSLQEALKLAEENNSTTQIAMARENAAKSNYQMTNAVFLPQLSVSHSAVTTNNPLSAFGFKLQQEIVEQSDFDPSLLNDPDDITNFSTSIAVQQPILNVDGFYERKAAHNQYESAQYQTVRVWESIQFEVKNAYYLLELAEASVDVLQQSVAVAEDAYKLTLDNEEQGFVKHSDVLEAAVRLEDRKNQLLEAKNQFQAANEYLAFLIGLDLSEQIQTTDSLVQPPAQVFVDHLRINLQDRSDLKAYEKQIEASENMLRSQKMKFIPRLNAFASYDLNDAEIAGFSATSYTVGASLSWDLFSGYKNVGATRKAKAQLNEAQLNYQDYLSQSQLQVNNSKRNIELSFDQIESSRLAKEQAEEALRIRTDRFKQGLEKTTDLLAAEALSSQKKLQYIQAIYNYKQAVFEMELLLENDINE